MGKSLKRDQRREEAEERNAKWAALSPQEKLKSLDHRGVAALKQRVKIQSQIV